MSNAQPPEGENVISLQNISRNFLSMLQRQHDMLAYSLAGLRTADLAAPGEPVTSTTAFGDAVVAALTART